MPNVMVVLPNIGGALCSSRKVWLTPTTTCTCRAVMLPRRGSRWKWLGCPKLPKRSQLLVGRSSPYCVDMWRRYCCLTSFFPIVDTCLSCEDIAWQSCGMLPRWRWKYIWSALLHRAAINQLICCIVCCWNCDQESLEVSVNAAAEYSRYDISL